MTLIGRLIRLGAAMVGCGVVAAALLPDPITAWHQVAQLLRSNTADGDAANDLTLAVSSLTVWLVMTWFTTSLLILAATTLPGRVGSAARAASSLVIPAVIRRVVCSALSISLAGGILAGTAQAADLNHAGESSNGSSTSRQAAPPNLDWPSPDGRGALDTPTAEPDTVTVTPGDSLWTISAQSLGANPSDRAVAATWPTWWERNRELIGENPDLIHPGQQLQSPQSSN